MRTLRMVKPHTAFAGRGPEFEATMRFGMRGELVTASAAAARLFGYESVPRLVEGSHRGELARLGLGDVPGWVHHVLKEGEMVVEDRRLVRRNGVAFPCRMIAAPWCTTGRVAG